MPGTFIDIGTDHGYLPVYLILNGVCPTAAASDINAAPLAKAMASAAGYGVADRMEFFLSDGFAGIEKSYDTACVCGMGGQVIADIIGKGEGKYKSLVLQPMTKAEFLRRYLWDNGYVIENELYPTQDGKAYAVMSARRFGDKFKYTYCDTYLGKIRPDTEGYLKYVAKIYSSAKKRYGGTKRGDDKTLICECEEILSVHCMDIK